MNMNLSRMSRRCGKRWSSRDDKSLVHEVVEGVVVEVVEVIVELFTGRGGKKGAEVLEMVKGLMEDPPAPY